MPVVKSVTLAEDPMWFHSRTIAAEPGAIEIGLEGPLIHIRIIGESPSANKLRHRLGRHIVLSRFDHAVLDDLDFVEPAKKK